MPRMGTEQAGFSVDEGPLCIRVRVWGFWSRELAQNFTTVFVDKCRAAVKPARLQIDARELKPQGDEGQAAFRAIMKAAPGIGFSVAQVLVPNAITRLQLARIAKECGLEGWTFEAANDTRESEALRER